MQLIGKYLDLMEAEHAAMRLRQRGILTHISSKHSFSTSGYITGAFEVGLWAILDSQYQDACAYLSDENHEITSGLTEEEMVQFEAKANQSSYNVFNKFIFYTGLIVLAFILTAVFIAKN